MPHIVKYQERMQCIKPKIWEEDLQYKYVRPISQSAVRALQIPDRFMDIVKSFPTHYVDYTPHDKCTLFNLIEEIIDETLSDRCKNSEFFNEFVDIKEVPYGRYNSDSDYRGS